MINSIELLQVYGIPFGLPTHPLALIIFACFVIVAAIANLGAAATAAEGKLFSGISIAGGFALVTTIFTALGAGGCRSSGCALAEIMVMALVWGWLFGIIATALIVWIALSDFVSWCRYGRRRQY